MQIFYLLFKPRLVVAYIPSTAKLMNGFYAPLYKFKMTNQEIERIGEKTIGFGKYRGRKLNTLPKDYLRYLYESHIVSVQNWNDVLCPFIK